MMSSGIERYKKQVRVLLIDDELSLGLTLARAMSDKYQIVCETNINDALERLGYDLDFDAILCDMNMPDGSGVALYKKVAQNWPGFEKKVIFMTGGICDEFTRNFLQAIPNSCLEKPFDLSTLERTLPAP